MNLRKWKLYHKVLKYSESKPDYYWIIAEFQDFPEHSISQNTWEKLKRQIKKRGSKPHGGISSHQSECLSLRSQQISNAGKSGEKGTLLHSRWECKLEQPPWGAVTMGNSLEILYKTQNRAVIRSGKPTSGHIPGKSPNSKSYKHPNVHSSTICKCYK